MSKLKAYWDSQSLFGKIVMAIALPIFAIVAGIEHLIARMTGATYNEVNIIVCCSSHPIVMDVNA